MIILDRPVYEKIWSGDIDQIISYDEYNGEFTVKNMTTGNERTHSTSLDCLNISFNLNFDTTDDECIKYVIDKGIKKLGRVPTRFYEILNPTKDSLTKLIDLLKKINNDEIPVKTCIVEEDRGRKYIDRNHEDTIDILEEIESLSCSSLIAPQGRCHWENISKLEKEGFKVFAGEKDSFGWLTGCIQTNKGIIVYG